MVFEKHYLEMLRFNHFEFRPLTFGCGHTKVYPVRLPENTIDNEVVKLDAQLCSCDDCLESAYLKNPHLLFAYRALSNSPTRFPWHPSSRLYNSQFIHGLVYEYINTSEQMCRWYLDNENGYGYLKTVSDSWLEHFHPEDAEEFLKSDIREKQHAAYHWYGLNDPGEGYRLIQAMGGYNYFSPWVVQKLEMAANPSLCVKILTTPGEYDKHQVEFATAVMKGEAAHHF